MVAQSKVECRSEAHMNTARAETSWKNRSSQLTWQIKKIQKLEIQVSSTNQPLFGEVVNCSDSYVQERVPKYEGSHFSPMLIFKIYFLASIKERDRPLAQCIKIIPLPSPPVVFFNRLCNTQGTQWQMHSLDVCRGPKKRYNFSVSMQHKIVLFCLAQYSIQTLW